MIIGSKTCINFTQKGNEVNDMCGMFCFICFIFFCFVLFLFVLFCFVLFCFVSGNQSCTVHLNIIKVYAGDATLLTSNNTYGALFFSFFFVTCALLPQNMVLTDFFEMLYFLGCCHIINQLLDCVVLLWLHNYTIS